MKTNMNYMFLNSHIDYRYRRPIYPSISLSLFSIFAQQDYCTVMTRLVPAVSGKEIKSLTEINFFKN